MLTAWKPTEADTGEVHGCRNTTSPAAIQSTHTTVMFYPSLFLDCSTALVDSMAKVLYLCKLCLILLVHNVSIMISFEAQGKKH